MPRGTREGKRAGSTFTRRDALKAAAVSVPIGASFLGALQAAGFTLDHQPYLQNVVGDQATILWTTNEPGIGRVEYSSDRSFSRIAGAIRREFTADQTRLDRDFFQYQATLSPLRDGIQYNYRIVVDEEILTPQPGAFTTPAAGPVRFLVFGDSGQGTASQFQLAPLLAEENANFALHTGDIAYPNGAYKDFDANFFAVYKNILGKTPLFLTPGNHDYYTDAGLPYRSLFAPPSFDVPFTDRGRYYSFDWGDIHFIALDTNNPLETPGFGRAPMLDWLERDLTRTRKFWRIAFFHHPPFPASPHHEQDEVSALVREKLMPVLDRYEVPLVFCGHDHNYQRHVPMRGGRRVSEGSGTQYFVTGGGGATLYGLPPSAPLLARGEAQYHYLKAEVSGPRLTVRAISTTGAEIESYVVAPAPVFTPAGVVNAASASAGLSPGSLISIYGHFFAPRDQSASAFPLPTQMQGTRVTFNGQNIPLVFASPSQINAQLPFGASGRGTLGLVTANATVTVPVSIAEAAPAIFGSPQPAIIRNDGTLVNMDSPAIQGEFVSIFGTGMGSVNGGIAAGQRAPNSPLYPASGQVEVLLGTDTVAPVFAGLAPGFAGVYQIVFRVPDSLPNGFFNLRVSAKGVASNTVGIPVGVQPRPDPPDPDPTPIPPFLVPPTPASIDTSMPRAAAAFTKLFELAMARPAGQSAGQDG